MMICVDCKWQGDKEDLVPISHTEYDEQGDPTELYDVAACPNCRGKNLHWLVGAS